MKKACIMAVSGFPLTIGTHQKTGSTSVVATTSQIAQRIFGRTAAPIPTGPRSTRAQHRSHNISKALANAVQNPASAQVNFRNSNGATKSGSMQVAGTAGQRGAQSTSQPASGMTIRGLAGPHVVEVRGFAPGTTAADIEEAMMSKGISVHSCRLLETSPKVIADILCDSKEDADRISEFHGQWVCPLSSCTTD